MNDKIWYVVRNTPGVRLIVGAETKPIPLTDEEFAQMQSQIPKTRSGSFRKKRHAFRLHGRQAAVYADRRNEWRQ